MQTITIHNQQEFYFWHFFIRAQSEFIEQERHELTEDALAAAYENLAEIKRTVRRYAKKHRFDFDNSNHLVRDDGIDGYVILIPLPRSITDEETAEEWFLENEYMERSNSPYDCTGQLFTSWYKIIERNGRFYAYHCIGRDC